MGIASRFSQEYMSAVVSGQSLGGIIAAIAQIISLAFKISPQHSALIYFIIADAMVISSLVSFVMVYRSEFFTHHMLKGNKILQLCRYNCIKEHICFIGRCSKTFIRYLDLNLFGTTLVISVSSSVLLGTTVEYIRPTTNLNKAIMFKERERKNNIY